MGTKEKGFISNKPTKIFLWFWIEEVVGQMLVFLRDTESGTLDGVGPGDRMSQAESRTLEGAGLYLEPH